MSPGDYARQWHDLICHTHIVLVLVPVLVKGIQIHQIHPVPLSADRNQQTATSSTGSNSEEAVHW